MKALVFTNLDLSYEVFPEEFPTAPMVGDKIISTTLHKNNFQLELEVVSRTFIQSSFNSTTCILHLELHLPKGRFESINHFYRWYAAKTNRPMSAFI